MLQNLIKKFKDFCPDPVEMFLARYGYLLFIAAGIIWMMGMKEFTELLKTILSIAAMECVVLALCNFAHSIFTHIRFTREHENSTDYEQAILRAANRKVLGYIFLGVHLFCGLALYSIYYIKMLPGQN